MSYSPVLLAVAALAGLLTFIVTRQAVRDEFKLGPPNLLAAVVSGLSVVGLLASPKGWWGAMLLPYAALGLTLVLLCLLAAFGLLFGPPRSRNFDKNRSPRRSEHPPSEAAKRRREHPRGD
jgi:hypothetical protein